MECSHLFCLVHSLPSILVGQVPAQEQLSFSEQFLPNTKSLSHSAAAVRRACARKYRTEQSYSMKVPWLNGRGTNQIDI
jgi:hypothetical protein